MLVAPSRSLLTRFALLRAKQCRTRRAGACAWLACLHTAASQPWRRCLKSLG